MEAEAGQSRGEARQSADSSDIESADSFIEELTAQVASRPPLYNLLPEPFREAKSCPFSLSLSLSVRVCFICARVCLCACVVTQTHACARTHAHTHTRTRAHTHTRTHGGGWVEDWAGAGGGNSLTHVGARRRGEYRCGAGNNTNARRQQRRRPAQQSQSVNSEKLKAKPYTLHPKPYTLNPTP